MSNDSTLMNHLFPGARQRVLAILLLQAHAAFHLRELARQTGSHPGTLARELDKLTQAGLLLRTELGNQVRYQANVENPLFADLASLFRKTHGIVLSLQQALQELDEQIDMAFIFGSVARDTAEAHSDVDLLVVGDATFTDIVRVVHPFQEKLRREINPVLYSGKEFASRLRQGDAFVTTLTSSPRIWIKGTDDDLGKLAGHQAAAIP